MSFKWAFNQLNLRRSTMSSISLLRKIFSNLPTWYYFLSRSIQSIFATCANSNNLVGLSGSLDHTLHTHWQKAFNLRLSAHYCHQHHDPFKISLILIKCNKYKRWTPRVCSWMEFYTLNHWFLISIIITQPLS